MNTVKTFVVCRDQAISKKWQSLSIFYENLEISCLVGSISYYDTINNLIRADINEPVLLLHDDVWIPIDFGARVLDLIGRLENTVPNWGACGNVGVRWDGEITSRHIYDPHGGPIPGVNTRHVTSIDGNAILLNCEALKRVQLLQLPDLNGFHGYDLVLSYELLRHGLAIITDPAMFVVHKSPGHQGSFDNFTRSPLLSDYIASNFKDFAVDTINGRVVLNNRQDFSYVDIQGGDTSVRVLDAYDATLGASRKHHPVTLTIAVRTQFKRTHLLRRLFTTIKKEVFDNVGLVSVDLLLVTDACEIDVDKGRESLDELASGFRYDLKHVVNDGTRASRVNLIFEAFEASVSDYIWFIDDDDFLLPGGLKAVARTLSSPAKTLVVFDCIRFTETWTEVDGINIIKSSRVLDRTDGKSLFNCLNGDNFVPNCGMVFPRAPVRAKLSSAKARMAYYEDYFVILVAMSVPEIYVEVLGQALCGISIRGKENTVTEEDRTIWDISHATVLSEISNGGLSIPMLWQKYDRLPRENHVNSLRMMSRSIGTRIADTVELDGYQRSDNAAIGYIDEFDINGWAITIKGWALSSVPNCDVECIIVITEDKVIAQFPLLYERTDLPQELYMTSNRISGFKVFINATDGWQFGCLPEVCAVVNGEYTPLKVDESVSHRVKEIVELSHIALSQDDFDESYYLHRHPDVAQAVKENSLVSGFQHWLIYGYKENRAYRVQSFSEVTSHVINHTRRRYRQLVND